MNAMIPREALEALVREGYFRLREDGWYQPVKPPTKKDLHFFIKALNRVSAYSVGDGCPVQVSSYDGMGLMFKIRVCKSCEPRLDMTRSHGRCEGYGCPCLNCQR